MQEIVLTTDNFAGFDGGQFIVENRSEHYVFLGQSKKICVIDGKIHVDFGWLARRNGVVPPYTWVKEEGVRYVARFSASYATDIGAGRIAVLCPAKGDMVIFYQPDCQIVHPSLVRGLQIAG